MKKIFYIFLILFFSSSIFAKASFFVELTPSLLLNTEDKKYSAPSPIYFPLSLGVQIETPFAKIEPSISLWTNYYLLAHDKALISEIENRTALAISSNTRLVFTLISASFLLSFLPSFPQLS